MQDRPLTPKEQKVVAEFEKARPGLGAIAERNIRNNHLTGWADIIADTPESELVVREGTYTTNPHGMYRRNF